jgi:hypothetical protein
MFTLRSRKPLFIGIIVLMMVTLPIALPIKLEYKIRTPGKLLPVKEWMMYKGTDGRLTSILTDYKSGINQSYEVTLFDRGDAIQFALRSGLHSGTFVRIKDTVAIIYSNEIERQIETLKGQIVSAKALLSLNLTGEKEAIINQEKNNLLYAEKKAEEQKKILDRLEALYKKGLASQEEYEVAKGTNELNQINILIAESRLKSVQTGSKPEQINYIKSQISALEKELTVIKKRYEAFNLLSPVSGVVIRNTNSDTLIVISDTSEFVMISPIRIQDKKFIFPLQKVEIYINNIMQDVKANIIEVSSNVQILNGYQVVTALSAIESKSSDLMPGLLIDCYINTGSLTPLQYLQRIWQRMVN